jgi:hypothetical protein
MNTLFPGIAVRKTLTDLPIGSLAKVRGFGPRWQISAKLLVSMVLALLLGCERPATVKGGLDQPEPAAAPTRQAAESADGNGADGVGTGARITDGSERADRANYSALPAGAELQSHRDSWHANYLQGKKIGFRHTVVRAFELGGKPYVQTDIFERQSLLRFGEKVTLEVKLVQVTDERGELLRIGYKLPIGTEVSRIQGKVAEGKLIYWSADRPDQAPEQLPCPAGTLGFTGLEDSLAKNPLLAGQQRTLKMLQLPPLPLIGTVELEAQAEESTTLPAGEVRLLRVDEKIMLPDGGSLLCHCWTDATGQVLKYSVPQVQQETYLVTQERALDASDAFSFDLGSDMLVHLSQPLADPHRQRRASYRVRLQTDSPESTVEKLLPAGLSQQVERIDGQTALVTVLAIRPDRPEELPQAQPQPVKADTQASSLIESDTPEIVSLANEATNKKSSLTKSPAVQPRASSVPWIQAVAIEKFVHDYLTRKNYSQAFSSAAEVARTREGDCTEHAVLVAALCRASGIPARVAFGLVYVASEQAFAFHMWNEAWIDDRWVPLDATLALGGIGAGHLKFGHSSLSDISALLELLPVMQAVGKLEISAAMGK